MKKSKRIICIIIILIMVLTISLAFIGCSSNFPNDTDIAEPNTDNGTEEQPYPGNLQEAIDNTLAHMQDLTKSFEVIVETENSFFNMGLLLEFKFAPGITRMFEQRLHGQIVVEEKTIYVDFVNQMTHNYHSEGDWLSLLFTGCEVEQRASVI